MKKNNKKWYYLICFFLLFLIFILHGENVWGEIIVEYMPYAYGTQQAQGSFAGYLTIFPIIIAKIYCYLFKNSFISWPLFANMISFLYTYLCIVTILKICEIKNLKTKTLVILMPLYILLIHPSVSSFINITHLGYLPIVLYIILSINDDDFSESLLKIPYYVFIPMMISVLSKPSLTFIPFILIILFTKIYKSFPRLIILLISIFVSAYQTLLYKSAATSLSISSLKGVVFYVISLFQSLGASIIFAMKFYITSWNQNQIIIFIIASVLIGVIIVSFCFYLLYKNKKFFDFFKRFLILASIGFIAVFPFTTIDYGSSITDILKINLTNVFSKYKLQYQLTACFIVFSILVVILNQLKNKKIKLALCLILMIGLSNGVFTSLYASHWPSVNSLKNIAYEIDKPFLYAPYAEWDYNWNNSATGWFWGNKVISKYKSINLENEIFFKNKNENLDEEVQEKIKDGKIYLFLIDNQINLKSETNYLEFFKYSNRMEDAILITDYKEIIIPFTQASYNNIRYAYIDFNEKVFNSLMSEKFNLKLKNQIESKYLNVVLVSM